MATYASWTDEQKARVQELLRLVRPWSGEIARANNHAEAAELLWFMLVEGAPGAGTLAALIDDLDPGETIPNETGLAEASPLSESDVQNLMTYLSAISDRTTGYNTDFHRTMYAKAAGAANTIG